MASEKTNGNEFEWGGKCDKRREGNFRFTSFQSVPGLQLGTTLTDLYVNCWQSIAVVSLERSRSQVSKSEDRLTKGPTKIQRKVQELIPNVENKTMNSCTLAHQDLWNCGDGKGEVPERIAQWTNRHHTQRAGPREFAICVRVQKTLMGWGVTMVPTRRRGTHHTQSIHQNGRDPNYYLIKWHRRLPEGH